MMRAGYCETDAVQRRLGEIAATPRSAKAADIFGRALELLDLSEALLEIWLVAHDAIPGSGEKEGFRLLALHAQASRGDPSFNACRETCREIAYQYNVSLAADDDAGRDRAFRLLVMVVRHLSLFITGKLEVAGLGEFCCASRPLHPAPNLHLVQGA